MMVQELGRQLHGLSREKVRDLGRQMRGRSRLLEASGVNNAPRPAELEAVRTQAVASASPACLFEAQREVTIWSSPVLGGQALAGLHLRELCRDLDLKRPEAESLLERLEEFRKAS